MSAYVLTCTHTDSEGHQVLNGQPMTTIIGVYNTLNLANAAARCAVRRITVSLELEHYDETSSEELNIGRGVKITWSAGSAYDIYEYEVRQYGMRQAADPEPEESKRKGLAREEDRIRKANAKRAAREEDRIKEAKAKRAARENYLTRGVKAEAVEATKVATATVLGMETEQVEVEVEQEWNTASESRMPNALKGVKLYFAGSFEEPDIEDVAIRFGAKIVDEPRKADYTYLGAGTEVYDAEGVDVIGEEQFLALLRTGVPKEKRERMMECAMLAFREEAGRG